MKIDEPIKEYRGFLDGKEFGFRFNRITGECFRLNEFGSWILDPEFKYPNEIFN